MKKTKPIWLGQLWLAFWARRTASTGFHAAAAATEAARAAEIICAQILLARAQIVTDAAFVAAEIAQAIADEALDDWQQEMDSTADMIATCETKEAAKVAWQAAYEALVAERELEYVAAGTCL